MITWTQEQSINFECAREVITDLISIYTAKIYIEKKKPEPDLKLILITIEIQPALAIAEA